VKARPVIPRAQVNRDIDDALARSVEVGTHAAASFITSLEQAFAQIGRHPASGSPSCAHALNLPGLRCWPLVRYPYVVFYVERPDHIDMWRILHRQQHVTAWIQEPEL
jgi:toxin ParE1/3/4